MFFAHTSLTAVGGLYLWSCVCMSVCLWVGLHLCLSVCGWGFISVRLSVGGALSLSVCLYVCPSVCGWGFISVCLSLCKQLHLTMFVSNLVQYHYSDVRKLFYYSLDNPGELVPRYVFSMFRVHIKMCSYLKISEIKWSELSPKRIRVLYSSCLVSFQDGQQSEYCIHTAIGLTAIFQMNPLCK